MNLTKVETKGPLAPAGFARQADALMSRLCRGMVRREQNYLTRGDLTLPQFWALEWVYSEGGGRLQDLMAALHLKSSTGTMLVDRMVTLGLLRRKRSASDRRSVTLAITARGTRAVQQIHLQRQAGVRRMFAPLSAQERKDYIALLGKMTRELFNE